MLKESLRRTRVYSSTYLVCHAWHQVPSIEYRVSNIVYRISNVKYRISNIVLILFFITCSRYCMHLRDFSLIDIVYLVHVYT